MGQFPGGLIVPAQVARDRGFHDGDLIEVEFRRKIPSLEELSGTIKFRTSLRTLMKEVKEGWDDL